MDGPVRAGGLREDRGRVGPGGPRQPDRTGTGVSRRTSTPTSTHGRVKKPPAHTAHHGNHSDHSDHEVETLEEFDAIVSARGTLAGFRVQSLDLTDRTRELLTTDTAGAVFLGCRMRPEAAGGDRRAPYRRRPGPPARPRSALRPLPRSSPHARRPVHGPRQGVRGDTGRPHPRLVPADEGERGHLRVDAARRPRRFDVRRPRRTTARGTGGGRWGSPCSNGVESQGEDTLVRAVGHRLGADRLPGARAVAEGPPLGRHPDLVLRPRAAERVRLPHSQVLRQRHTRGRRSCPPGRCFNHSPGSVRWRRASLWSTGSRRLQRR